MWAGKDHSAHAAAGHSDGTGSVEAALALAAIRIALDRARSDGRVTWRLLLLERVLCAFATRDTAELRAGVVDVGSMAISWVADLDLRQRVRR